MPVTLLAACLIAPATHAGDLWLEIRTESHEDVVQVDVPANWLPRAEDPVEVQVEGRSFDLRQVARAAKARKEGTRIQLLATDDQGQPYELALEHRRVARRAGPAPQQLTVSLQGDEGERFDLHLPLLLGEGAISLAGEGFEADIEVDGLEIPWEAEEFLAQLRSAPPTALVQLDTHDGGRVTISTE
jgi:hypothetical protein